MSEPPETAPTPAQHVDHGSSPVSEPAGSPTARYADHGSSATSASPTQQSEGPSPPKPRSRRRRGRPSRARGRPNSSDDATARWTIRGVPSPVREMALAAANERGMTVGDWVAEAIVATARSRVAAGPRLPATEAETPPDIVKLVRSLDERLTRMEARQQAGFFGRLFGRRN